MRPRSERIKEKKEKLHWLNSWDKGLLQRPNIKKTIAGNIEGYITSAVEPTCSECKWLQLEELWDLNWRFMDLLPEYFSDLRYVMHGPCALIFHEGEKYSVMAKTVRCETSYTYEYLQDLFTIGNTTRDDILDEITHRLADEFRTKRYSQPEKSIVCPYVPILKHKWIAGDTMQPKLGFMMKYGLLEPGNYTGE